MGDLGNSNNANADHLQSRHIDPANAFQSQLNNYTGLPKIKRKALQQSPMGDNGYYRTRPSPKSDKKNNHWSHRENYSSNYCHRHSSAILTSPLEYRDRQEDGGHSYHRSKDSYHHRYDKYRDHRHHNRDDYHREDRQNSRPPKKIYDTTHGFVSETDDSDLGTNVRRDESMAKESKTNENSVANNFDDSNSYPPEKPLPKDVKKLKPTVNKIWRSSDDDDEDTDKTETMAAKDNHQSRKPMAEKKGKTDIVSDADSLVVRFVVIVIIQLAL